MNKSHATHLQEQQQRTKAGNDNDGERRGDVAELARGDVATQEAHQCVHCRADSTDAREHHNDPTTND